MKYTGASILVWLLAWPLALHDYYGPAITLATLGATLFASLADSKDKELEYRRKTHHGAVTKKHRTIENKHNGAEKYP